MGEVEPAEIRGVFKPRQVLDLSIARVETGEYGEVARHDRPGEQRFAVESHGRLDAEGVGEGQPQALVGEHDLAVDAASFRGGRGLTRHRLDDPLVGSQHVQHVAEFDTAVGIRAGRRERREDVGHERVGARTAHDAVDVGAAHDQVVAVAAGDPVAVVEFEDVPDLARRGEVEIELERAGRGGHPRRAVGGRGVDPEQILPGVEPADVGGRAGLGKQASIGVEEVEEEAGLQRCLGGDGEPRRAAVAGGHAERGLRLRQRLVDVEPYRALREAV